MQQAIKELGQIIAERRNHFLILHGNVNDTIRFADKDYDGIADFLINMKSSQVVFPWCLTYDIFSGTDVMRGEIEDIAAIMGIKEEKGTGPDVDLIAALKQSKKQSENSLPIDPDKAFPCFDALLKKSFNPTLLIIDYAESLVPASLQNTGRFLERMIAVGFAKWSKSKKIREAGHLIVLICREANNLEASILDRSFESAKIRIPKPGESERLARLQEIHSPEASIILAKATSGLSLKDLNGAVFSSGAKPDDALDSVFSFKKGILRDEYGDVLEMLKPRFGFEAIGGLEHLVTEFKLIAKDMREGCSATVPMGILMMGPPGTGKTVFAEATAEGAGVNFVKPLDLKNMWLGESERRATKFYNALRDLAPVIAWFDEVDTQQKQRGGFDGDSGVSSNMFGKMLEFASDTSLRGKVLLMFATNRPDLLDSALKRDGRCDMRVALLPPDVSQLAKICQAAFRQYPEMKSEIADWNPYTKQCKGYNGANMIEVVRRAWVRAARNGRKQIIDKDVKWALSDYIPQRADEQEIARMALISILNCSSKSLLPPNWEELRDYYLRILRGDARKDQDLESEDLAFIALNNQRGVKN